MKYEIGQHLCLWQVITPLGSTHVRVVKEVVVRIIAEKTGAPGELSKRPLPFQSLKAVDEDGNIYEKHWKRWPEEPGCDFTHSWSRRHDGAGHDKDWVPVEAVHVYNELTSTRRGFRRAFSLTDRLGNPIAPKGDVNYCFEHDVYVHLAHECEWCYLDNMTKRRRAAPARKK